jgi:hypothetical protein
MHLSAMVLVAPDVGGVLGVQFPVLHFSTLFFSFSTGKQAHSGDPNDHKLLYGSLSATLVCSLRYVQ